MTIITSQVTVQQQSEAQPALIVQGMDAFPQGDIVQVQDYQGNMLFRVDRSGYIDAPVFVKSGAPLDSDFVNPRDGILVVDITDLRLYARANGAWHYAALT